MSRITDWGQAFPRCNCEALTRGGLLPIQAYNLLYILPISWTVVTTIVCTTCQEEQVKKSYLLHQEDHPWDQNNHSLGWLAKMSGQLGAINTVNNYINKVFKQPRGDFVSLI